MWPFKNKPKTALKIPANIRKHISQIAEMGYPASAICEAFNIEGRAVQACLEEFGESENKFIVHGVHYYLRPPASPVSDAEIELDILTEQHARFGYVAKSGDAWTSFGEDKSFTSDDRFRAATLLVIAITEAKNG